MEDKKLQKWFNQLFKPKDIYGAQQPLIIFTFLCGITPFKLVGKTGNRRIEMTIIGYIHTIIHISVFGFCFVITLNKKATIVGYFFNTQISKIGDMLQLVTGLLALTITFMCCLLKRHKVIGVIHFLKKIDEDFKQLGIETDYKSTLRYILIVLTFKISIYMVYLFGSYFLLDSVLVYPCVSVWVSFFLPHMVISSLIALFMCLIKQIRHRFLLLNKVCVFYYIVNLCFSEL